jgi:hypothetical protein
MPEFLEQIDYPRSWTSATLRREDWFVAIPPACVAELRGVLSQIQPLRHPAETLRTVDFELSACAAFLAGTRQKLDNGTGFVCYDRLPVEDCANVEEAKALYWLMASLLEEPQPQYFERHMIYDLRYTGIHEEDNEQAHRVKTDEIEPHSDESLPDIGPKYVGLMCWRQARTGGASRLFSFLEAYRRMVESDPALATRLTEPYFWLPERKVPDDAIYYHPVVTRNNGRLRFQHSQDYNWRGYQKWGETFDTTSSAALQMLSDRLVETMFEVTLQPGQFALFHNDTVAHGRSFHTDWPEPERKRHILRLWLGQSGETYPVPDTLRARLLARKAA